MRTIISLLAVTALTSVTFGAGFDCAKASTPTEKAICADKELSDLDSRLASLYGAVRKAIPADQANSLKASQVTWLKECRVGADKASLRSAYTRRVECLEAIQKAAAAFSPFGEYGVEHVVDVYNQETDARETSTASDSYVLTKVGEKAITFSITIVGNNGHECNVADTARLTGPGEYVWTGSASDGASSDEPCTIRFTVLKDRVRVSPSGAGCSGFCGARVGLSQAELRAVERVK